ncbi:MULTISPECIES: hypothetical protein [Tsukamurella]|uniref:hypothetical protein n=1 Tax=Tsukamurella TaxID=2060 RepID=UPI0015F12BBA|nr:MULTISPECIES: hypothetical protein [Tsukamurella]
MVERYYAAEGPLASSVFEVSADYFDEGLTYGRAGGVRVDLADGSTEWITGTRYLNGEGARVRAEAIEGVLEVIYMGEVWRTYPAEAWTGWSLLEQRPDPDASGS